MLQAHMSSREALCTLPAGAPDGNIRLFCKGSDSKVMSMLRPEPGGGGGRRAGGLLAATHENLHVFATHVRPWDGVLQVAQSARRSCSAVFYKRIRAWVGLRALPGARAAACCSKPVRRLSGVARRREAAQGTRCFGVHARRQ